MASIGTFLWILIHNALRRRSVIAEAIRLPLPGCPSIHTGIEWAQWVPATAFEGVLFGWASYKTLKSSIGRWTSGANVSLYELILRDNLIYFFGIACLLIFNNLMVVGVTKIPWFSYSPFHAAMEIITSRMLINLYKASVKAGEIGPTKQSTIAVFSSGGFTLSKSGGSEDGDMDMEGMGMDSQGMFEMKKTDNQVKDQSSYSAT